MNAGVLIVQLMYRTCHRDAAESSHNVDPDSNKERDDDMRDTALWRLVSVQ